MDDILIEKNYKLVVEHYLFQDEDKREEENFGLKYDWNSILLIKGWTLKNPKMNKLRAKD